MLWTTKHSKEEYSEPAPARREYTRKEKLSNWWYYHKWLLLGGAAAIIVLVMILKDQFGRPVPDYQIAVAAKLELPVDTAEAIAREITPYCEDLNGDGQVLITFKQFTVDFDTMNENTNAYSQMAGVTHLFAELNQDHDCRIILLEDPVSFAAGTSALLKLDGSFPVSEVSGSMDSSQHQEPSWYNWNDCPILSSLPLGRYKGYTIMDTQEGDSQEVMSGFSIARLSIPLEKMTDLTAASDILWDALTDGASAD